MARNPLLQLESLKASIRERWHIVDWRQHFPWWQLPPKVRILMYADGSVRFNGGPFLGLQYVKTLLESRAYVYVDFDIATAHRDGSDPSASITGAVKLTDLDILNQYDQIWFFGINKTPNLSGAELALLDQFMAAPKFGGVLVTGDHDDLGKGIAGQITRAGQMRQYPAPPASFPGWNTTLEQGADDSFEFDNQSDDKPQSIRYTRFPIWSPVVFKNRYRPHPVFCGPDGPIDVFPDHQHEGEALAPIPSAGDPNWPSKAGYQERPYVIAWGRINDPSATRHGQEIGLASAYDGHNVDVGRIVADSTWHHWFDINLTGLAGHVAPSPYAGFDATPSGQDVLRKIDAYFLNCGVWLSPPDKQMAMRHFGWWSILWTDRFVEIPKDLPIWVYGEHAIDALGRRASRCAVESWIFDTPIFKEKIPHWEWPTLLDRMQLVNLPFEQYVAGGIARQLLLEVGPMNDSNAFPDKAPKAEILEKAIARGINEGLAALGQQLRRETSLALKLVEEKFCACSD